MPTKWVVTTPGDQIELDEAQQAETTFTVTNPTGKVDRVVFDIATGEGADTSWFSVEQPQRRVPASGSVSYLMKTAIPLDAKPGIYSVQGRAYSADSAPEEDSVLSSRLVIEIAPKKAPAPKKKLPSWWIYVVIGLVVIVLGVIGSVFVFGGVKQVTAPDVTHEPLNQAKTNLAVFGLGVGTIRYQQDAAFPGEVLAQSVVGGAKVDQDQPVDLVVTISLAMPTPNAPAAGATVPRTVVAPPTVSIPTEPAQFTALDSPSPDPSAGTVTSGALSWSDSDPFVTHWQVTIYQRVCLDLVGIPARCAYVTSSVVRVNQPSYTPMSTSLWPSPAPSAAPTPAPTPATILLPYLGNVPLYPNTTFQWSVAAVDDFGNVGPASPLTTYVVQ
jgi:hypothetical protein